MISELTPYRPAFPPRSVDACRHCRGSLLLQPLLDLPAWLYVAESLSAAFAEASTLAVRGRREELSESKTWTRTRSKTAK